MKQPPGNDSLFRHAFSHPVVARQFLSRWLPKEFSCLVDWSSLQIEKVSGITKALTERREDLVYRIRVKGMPIWFYILLEHQSGPHRRMPLRILEYILLVWQQHERQFPGQPLPLIIPIVLYPGPSKWTSVRRLQDLIDIPKSLQSWARKFLPDAGFVLVELAGLPLEKLADGPTARAVLGALQEERVGAMDYEAIRTILAEIFSDSQKEIAEAIAPFLWQYVLRHSDLQSSEVDCIVEQTIPPPQRPDYMTTAERLRNEGIEQGYSRGIEDGQIAGQIVSLRSAVIEVLQVRFDRVPEGLVDAIEAIADHGKLRILLRTAIRCSDLEAFSRAL